MRQERDRNYGAPNKSILVCEIANYRMQMYMRGPQKKTGDNLKLLRPSSHCKLESFASIHKCACIQS